MKVKTILLDDQAVKRALKRISHEIAETNKGVKNVVLLGIARGGIPISNILANNIYDIEGVNVPVGTLDITLYRDDLNTSVSEAKVIGSNINFSIADKDVVLCDDVLYTGRTVRAGIEAIFKKGRPRSIQLAVLIDRGHRELPIRADYVGKNVPTSKEEVVDVVFNNDRVGKALILVKESNNEKQ